ncbi:hypothetical protein ACFWPQ_03170 [Streptomyces sp. NPDC058464]|uniref:hypothetical protein n=1 Tax=Streptomyces sp. NPDC058464 TaxID=3346511 RepID=UPI00365320C8
MLLGPRRPARRRLVRDVSLAGVGLASVGLAVCMLVDRQSAINVATIAGLFLGIR